MICFSCNKKNVTVCGLSARILVRTYLPGAVNRGCDPRAGLPLTVGAHWPLLVYSLSWTCFSLTSRSVGRSTSARGHPVGLRPGDIGFHLLTSCPFRTFGELIIFACCFGPLSTWQFSVTLGTNLTFLIGGGEGWRGGTFF